MNITKIKTNLRNIKYKIALTKKPEDFLTIKKLIEMLNAKADTTVNQNEIIAFFGFYNEFEVIYGKKCVFLCFGDNAFEKQLAKKAIKEGATAILCEKKIDGLPCIMAQDINKAFISICNYYRNQIQPSTVAVTGSVGKTTTKQFVETVLSEHWRTFCTPINGNILKYLGFIIQRVPKNTQWIIQEVDESYPENPRLCSELLKPQIAIITNIDKSHIGEMGGVEEIKKAIASISAGMSKEGHIIINADDQNSTECSFIQHVHRVSLYDHSVECFATDITLSESKISFQIHYGEEIQHAVINCPGRHNVYNALMAFVVGKISGTPSKKIIRGLKKYKPLTIRQTTYNAFGKTAYVDCFNSSAKSVEVALKTADLLKTKHKGKRIAVLGDILEINGYENEVYSSVAESLENSKTDILITYGENSKMINHFLKKNDLITFHFDNDEQLIQFIKRKQKTGDVLLYKASGGMEMEKIVRKIYPFSIFLGMIPYYKKRLFWEIKVL